MTVDHEQRAKLLAMLEDPEEAVKYICQIHKAYLDLISNPRRSGLVVTMDGILVQAVQDVAEAARNRRVATSEKLPSRKR